MGTVWDISSGTISALGRVFAASLDSFNVKILNETF